MQTPSPDDLKRRARAALGYSLMTRKELEEDKLGLGERGLERQLRPSWPEGPSIEQAWQIADACGVPRDFITHGWGWARSLEARLADLEAQMAAALIEGAARDEDQRHQERDRPPAVDPRDEDGEDADG